MQANWTAQYFWSDTNDNNNKYDTFILTTSSASLQGRYSRTYFSQ